MSKEKNMDKVTRKLDGASADAKKKAIHKMLEALINEDNDAATEALHDYLQSKMRQMILEARLGCPPGPG